MINIQLVRSIETHINTTHLWDWIVIYNIELISVLKQLRHSSAVHFFKEIKRKGLQTAPPTNKAQLNEKLP